MWQHKKYKKRIFKGSYQRVRGERVFMIQELLHNVKHKRVVVSFESWQMAEKLGWEKVA